MSAKFEYDPEFDAAMSKPRPRRRSRIIEVFMVLATIVVSIALCQRSSHCGPGMRRAQCTNNLKQIALALCQYEQAHNALPPACTIDAKGSPLHSWRTLILPYLEQEALFKRIDLSKPWNDPANAEAMETVLPVFQCPEAREPRNRTTYLAIVGPNCCLLPERPRRLAEITDAHDKTLMVIEADEQHAVPWMAPVDANESLVMSLSNAAELHRAGGTNAAMVDGSVMFLKASTPAKVRRAMISIAGDDNAATKTR